MPAAPFRGDRSTRPLPPHGRPVSIDYEAMWLTQTSRRPAIEALTDAVGRTADSESAR